MSAHTILIALARLRATIEACLGENGAV